MLRRPRRGRGAPLFSGALLLGLGAWLLALAARWPGVRRGAPGLAEASAAATGANGPEVARDEEEEPRQQLQQQHEEIPQEEEPLLEPEPQPEPLEDPEPQPQPIREEPPPEPRPQSQPAPAPAPRPRPQPEPPEEPEASGGLTALVLGLLALCRGLLAVWAGEQKGLRPVRFFQRARRITVQHASAGLEAANQGRLVHVQGLTSTVETLRDPLFGVEVRNTLKLRRKVEMFQWTEHAEVSASTQVAGTCRCRTFCSGALVAPGAVLTAAHCLWSTQNRSALRPGLRIGEEGGLFVVLGHETLAAAQPESFFLVHDAVHGGYQNIAQVKDNDIALVFLSTCAAGRATARVGTAGALGGGEACTQVTGLGWGRQDSFDYYWGMEAASPLKATTDFFIHSSEVCTTEYRRAVVDRVGVLPFYNFTAQQLAWLDRTLDVSQEFSPDRHLCYGASSEAGMCFGDSGGPLLANDSESGWVVLAVNGWTMNKCGIYADFGARVAFFASWVREELERRPDALCGTPLSAVFASWPPAAWNRSEADSGTRCFAQGERWACRNSTGNTCIAWSQRCDGVPDCSDGSDEEHYAGCALAPSSLPEADACQAVLAKLASSYQAAEESWWLLQDAIQGARSRNNGVIPTSSHGQVAEACDAWLRQASEPVRLHSLNDSDKALLSACEGNVSRDAEMRAAVRVYANRNATAFLGQLGQVAGMCQSQILYNSLFLTGRASLIEEFVRERQRCPRLNAGLRSGSTSPSNAGSTPGWAAAVLMPVLLSFGGWG